MSIEKEITCSYTHGIYAKGYIAFVFPFVRSSVCSFVRSLLSVALVEFTSQFSDKAHWTQVSDRCPLYYLFKPPVEVDFIRIIYVFGGFRLVPFGSITKWFH